VKKLEKVLREKSSVANKDSSAREGEKFTSEPRTCAGVVEKRSECSREEKRGEQGNRGQTKKKKD